MPVSGRRVDLSDEDSSGPNSLGSNNFRWSLRRTWRRDKIRLRPFRKPMLYPLSYEGVLGERVYGVDEAVIG
jgi:hypothetical protein